MNTNLGRQREGTPSARLGVVIAAMLLLGLSAVQARSNFALDWFSVDAGGGTSTGGLYSVTGTVGQPDAGHLSAAGYAIDGGFWGLIAAFPGPPLLTITRTATNSVLVRWPSPSTGWTLYQNANLSTTNWSVVVATPVDDGNTKSVMIALPLGNQFYRLQMP